MVQEDSLQRNYKRTQWLGQVMKNDDAWVSNAALWLHISDRHPIGSPGGKWKTEVKTDTGNIRKKCNETE